jgi:hypothetical protein
MPISSHLESLAPQEQVYPNSPHPSIISYTILTALQYSMESGKGEVEVHIPCK